MSNLINTNGATAANVLMPIKASVVTCSNQIFQNKATDRWQWFVAGTESGANVGSDLFLARYSDSGGYLSAPFGFTRSTGNVTLEEKLSIGTGLSLAVDVATKPTSDTWQISSDVRIKSDIKAADHKECVDLIKAVQLRRFQWRNDIYEDSALNNGDRNVLGFIADEVEQVLPKAVRVIPGISRFKTKDENGEEQVVEIEDLKCLSTNQLNMALFGAVKDLLARVEALESA